MEIAVIITVLDDSVVLAATHIQSPFVQVVDTCWCISDQTSCLRNLKMDLSSHSQLRMKAVS